MTQFLSHSTAIKVCYKTPPDILCWMPGGEVMIGCLYLSWGVAHRIMLPNSLRATSAEGSGELRASVMRSVE